MASEDVARERDEVLAALQRDRPGEPSDRCRTGAALEPTDRGAYARSERGCGATATGPGGAG
jgi:hypothetical protein